VRDLSLKEKVVIAWLVAAFALPLLLIMASSHLPVVLIIVDLLAVLVAVPVATIGTLVLIVLRLSRPNDEDAADYDETTAEPDTRQ
jgi:hypothetical protein